MLRGIQSTLRRVAQRVPDDYSRSALAAIDVVLNEILSRRQRDFYTVFYVSIRHLATDGLMLVSANAPDNELVAAIGALPETLDPALDFAIFYRWINRAMHCLVELVGALQTATHTFSATFLRLVTAKEHELLAQGQVFAAAERSSQTSAEIRTVTRQNFQAYIQKASPEQAGLHVANFKELTGGYQKTTILVDTQDDSGRGESIVIRAEKDDRFVTLDAGDIRSEFEVVKLAHAANVPVAEPLWIEPDASVLGQRFFVSRKVQGINLGSAISADVVLQPEVIQDFVKTLALIHAVPIDAALRASPIGRWTRFATMADNTRANVDYWMDQRWALHANPSPILKRLRMWLESNVPDSDDAACFVHGDYGLHNVLVAGNAVSGVLDWEAARVGDPAEDISWFLQSSAGKIDSEQTLRWYFDLTGRRVSDYRLRYYDVFNCMKILVGAACAAGMHEKTPHAAIEWCNIPFLWAPVFASSVDARIEAANAARRA